MKRILATIIGYEISLALVRWTNACDRVTEAATYVVEWLER